MNTAAHTEKSGIQTTHLHARPLFFQPKLSINQPNDVYEQEADAMAERVMHAPIAKAADFFQPKPVATNIVQQKCAHCEDEEKVQRKVSTGTATGSELPSSVHCAVNSGGQSMDAGTRNFMESGFGYDFGNVQIHNDSQAQQSAASINALAYTHHNHIVFGKGQYQPHTHSGKQLLAHELVHTIQQNQLGSTQNKVFRKASFTDDPVKYSKDINPAEELANEIKNAGSSKMGQTLIEINGFVIEEGKPVVVNPLHIPAIASTAAGKHVTCTYDKEADNDISFRMHLPVAGKWEFEAQKADLANLQNPALGACGNKVKIIVVPKPNQANFVKAVRIHENVHRDSINAIYKKHLLPWDKKMHDNLNHPVPAKDDATCRNIIFKVLGADADELLFNMLDEFNKGSRTFHGTRQGGTVTNDLMTVDCSANTLTIPINNPMPIPPGP